MNPGGNVDVVAPAVFLNTPNINRNQNLSLTVRVVITHAVRDTYWSNARAQCAQAVSENTIHVRAHSTHSDPFWPGVVGAFVSCTRPVSLAARAGCTPRPRASHRVVCVPHVVYVACTCQRTWTGGRAGRAGTGGMGLSCGVRGMHARLGPCAARGVGAAEGTKRAHHTCMLQRPGVSFYSVDITTHLTQHMSVTDHALFVSPGCAHGTTHASSDASQHAARGNGKALFAAGGRSANLPPT